MSTSTKTMNFNELTASFALSTPGAYYAVTSQKEARARLKALSAAVSENARAYGGYLNESKQGIGTPVYNNYCELLAVVDVIAVVINQIDNKKAVNGAAKTLSDLNALYTNTALLLDTIAPYSVFITDAA